MPKKIHAVCWISLTFVLPAFADTVVAKNAGSLPGSAQDLSGDLALTEITGCLDFPYGVSMFKIDIGWLSTSAEPTAEVTPIVARCGELANDDTCECRQRLLTLFVCQPIPQLIEKQRDRRVRGGTTTVTTWDMSLLLGSRTGELASTATAQISRKGRLWASSPNSVKA